MAQYQKYIKAIGIILLFVLCYLAGYTLAARFSPEASGSGRDDTDPAVSSAIMPAAENWGLSFQEEGKTPDANATLDELKEYDTYYAEDTEEKKLYRTFDCGY